jgi:hypothetical protein
MVALVLVSKSSPLGVPFFAEILNRRTFESPPASGFPDIKQYPQEGVLLGSELLRLNRTSGWALIVRQVQRTDGFVFMSNADQEPLGVPRTSLTSSILSRWPRLPLSTSRAKRARSCWPPWTVRFGALSW